MTSRTPWLRRLFDARAVGARRGRQRRWLRNGLIIGCAVLCGLLGGPPGDLSARLGTRWGWIRELNAITEGTEQADG